MKRTPHALQACVEAGTCDCVPLNDRLANRTKYFITLISFNFSVQSFKLRLQSCNAVYTYM